MTVPARIVVIGGGVAGLATAALAARGGAQVTLVEGRNELGGRAGRWRSDGFTFDTGPSWFFMPEVFEHFFALFGRRLADHVDLVPLDPSYRVFSEPDAGAAAETLDVTGDAEKNWRTFEAIEPGAGIALQRYAQQATDAYKIALDTFLYTTFQRPDRLINRQTLLRAPELAMLLTTPLANLISRTVRDPKLQQLLGYHAVFLGSSPYRTPALYRLMSHLDLASPILYPRGGIWAVIAALITLAQQQGVKIITGTPVANIDVHETGRTSRSGADGLGRAYGAGRADGAGRARDAVGRARGVVLTNGQTIAADIVISAADLHHTETQLLPERWATYPAQYWQRRGPGVSALLAHVGIRGPIPQLPHHSLFFTRDWPKNFAAILGNDPASSPQHLAAPDLASIYVAKPTATEPQLAPPGHEALTMLVPFPAAPELPETTGDGLNLLVDRYLDQVAAWAQIPDLRQRITVRRVVGPADFDRDLNAWRGGALGMEHTLRQSAMFRPANRSRRVTNLLYAGGTTTPGVGLPMCLISAELVIKRLLGETSTRPLPAPLRPGFWSAVRR